MKTEEITIPWGCSIDVIDMYNSLGTGMRAELGETLRDWVSGWNAHNETRWREDWAHLKHLAAGLKTRLEQARRFLHVHLRRSCVMAPRRNSESVKHDIG